MKSMISGAVFVAAFGAASSAMAMGTDDGAEGHWASEAPTDGEAKSDASDEGDERKSAQSDEDDSPHSAGGDADGARFRWGIAGSGGLLSLSSLSGALGYGGGELRLGVQINDLVGIYAQPQLGFYSGTVSDGIGNSASGTGGIVGVTGLVDFTFDNTFFVAGGLGYGVLNSPSGVELHFRGGMYPLLGGGEEEARRHALMVGVDFRVFLVDGATGISPTLSLGYESF